MPADVPAAERALAGRYELGELLGRGATGVVRAGWDRHLDRPVAVKVMRADMAVDAIVRRRYDTEAQTAARLSHPNVVTIYDTGDPGWPATPYIVMERLPGTTLRDAVAAGPLSVADGRRLAVQVLAALAAAHRSGLVHRDIKPSNVLSAGPGCWKVADFGVAESLDGAPDEIAAGLVVGTPAYLAPERLYGRPATVASDLFSVGVVLFEALTGRRPFETAQAYPWSGALAGRPAPALRSVRPDVDPDLAAVVDRALHLDPRRRFTSAAAMAAALTPAPVGPAPDRDRAAVGARRGLIRLGAALAGAGAAATAALLLVGGAPATPARLSTVNASPKSAPAITPIAAVAPTSTTVAPSSALAASTGPALTSGVSTTRDDRSAVPAPGVAPPSGPGPTRGPAPAPGRHRSHAQDRPAPPGHGRPTAGPHGGPAGPGGRHGGPPRP